MKPFVLVLIPILAAWLVVDSFPANATGLGAQCKAGLTTTQEKIDAMTDATKKQQAQQLHKGAFTDLKSGEYQNCLDKEKQIDELAK